MNDGLLSSREFAQMVLRAEGEEYTLDLPLAAAAGPGARVGRLGDDVVVEYGTARRWLPLPPVLTRCDAVKAVRRADGLRVTFTPDAAVWRQRAGTQS